MPRGLFPFCFNQSIIFSSCFFGEPGGVCGRKCVALTLTKHNREAVIRMSCGHVSSLGVERGSALRSGLPISALLGGSSPCDGTGLISVVSLDHNAMSSFRLLRPDHLESCLTRLVLPLVTSDSAANPVGSPFTICPQSDLFSFLPSPHWSTAPSFSSGVFQEPRNWSVCFWICCIVYPTDTVVPKEWPE